MSENLERNVGVEWCVFDDLVLSTLVRGRKLVLVTGVYEQVIPRQCDREAIGNFPRQ